MVTCQKDIAVSLKELHIATSGQFEFKNGKKKKIKMDLQQILFSKDSHSVVSHCTYSYNVPWSPFLLRGGVAVPCP